MKRLLFTIFSFIITVSTVYAQKGINEYVSYGAGGRLTMHVDSGAQHVYSGIIFPNQPNTSFYYLPKVNQVSVQMYFQKIDKPENFRYTVLVDDKPIALNKPINNEDLKEVIRKDMNWNDELLDSTKLGIFTIKDKTLMTYYKMKNRKIFFWTQSNAIIELVGALHACDSISHGKIGVRKIKMVYQILLR